MILPIDASAVGQVRTSHGQVEVDVSNVEGSRVAQCQSREENCRYPHGAPGAGAGAPSAGAGAPGAGAPAAGAGAPAAGAWRRVARTPGLVRS